MDWDKLRIFHAVAEAGSLTHGAEALHLSQSAISRQIRALEENLRTILFHRHARGLILTEQGELLFKATSDMVKRLGAASAHIRDSREQVAGDLRVTTTTGFGTLWLMPRLDKLYRSYPDLKIDLMLKEQVLDLPMREADVAIRMKEPTQADLVRLRLINIRMQLFATSDYLHAHGAPCGLDGLRNHRVICQGSNAAQVAAGEELVRRLMDEGVSKVLTVNNYFGVLQGVLHNLGIGVLPDYLIQDFAQLVQVLPQIESTVVPVFLAYPEELRHSRRIRAFRDFVVKEIMPRNRGARPDPSGHKPHAVPGHDA